MSSFSMWQFCTEIKAPVAALDWLEKELSTPPKDDDLICHFSRETADTIQVWVEVKEQEDGDPFVLAGLVAEMQKLFDLKDPWSITWAVVHDRPWVDGFRGGAAVCYKGEVTQIDTQDWARDIIEKLQGGGHASRDE